MKKFRKLVFVYGTLKASHGNHRCIEHPTTKFLGEIKTAPKYTLLDGGFPICERDGATAITGELYEVNNEDVYRRVLGLEGCTGEKGHPDNWYDIDEDVETPHGNASIFVMDKGESRRSHVVESGIWR